MDAPYSVAPLAVTATPVAISLSGKVKLPSIVPRCRSSHSSSTLTRSSPHSSNTCSVTSSRPCAWSTATSKRERMVACVV